MTGDVFSRGSMKLFLLIFLTAVLQGCEFWDKEIVDVYAPDSRRDKQREFYIQSLNYHLGKPKADRIRAIGPPDQCRNQNSTTEICEWTQVGQPLEHTVTYTYGRDGLATAWSYRGSYGEFTNANYETAKSAASIPGKNRNEAARPQEENWVHPSKTSVQFDEDDVQCRTEVQGYPKSMWDTESDKCLRRHGWTRVQKP